MFRAFLDWVIPPRLWTVTALEEATERAATRLTHKSTVGYCRIKASTNARQLFTEAPFAQAMELCRWEAFAALLADHVRVVEGRLRPVAGENAEAVGDHLVSYYERVLNGYVHPSGNADAWHSHIDAMRGQIARARLARPVPAYELCIPTGNRIYDSLPLHKNLRREDREVICNHVRFGLVSFQQDLERRLDDTAVVAEILGGSMRR